MTRTSRRIGLRCRHTTTFTQLAVVCLALVASLVASARPAFAHGRLLSSQPKAGAQLAAAPSQLLLTFSEKPVVALSKVTVRGPGERSIVLGALGADPKDARTLRVPVGGPMESGEYTVRWRMAGADGHPVQGEFKFTVTIAPAATDIVPAEVGPSDFGVTSPAYVVVRAVQFIAVILLLGTLTVRAMILPRVVVAAGNPAAVRTGVHTRLARLVTLAWWVTLGAAGARLAAQHAAFFGAEAPWTVATMRALLLQSAWGWTWIGSVAAIIIGVASARGVLDTKSTRFVMLAAAVLAYVSTLPLSGHPAAASERTAAVLLDIAHIVGASAWIGGLAVLLVAAFPLLGAVTGADEAIALLMRAFSPIALLSATLLLVTGAAAAWRNLGSLAALWQSDYGRVLSVKLGLIGVTAAIGAYNWKRVLPQLGQPIGTARLRRSATVELAIALFVVIATAVLVATPLAGESANTFTSSS